MLNFKKKKFIRDYISSVFSNNLKGNKIKNIFIKMLHNKAHRGHCKIIIDPFVNYSGNSQNFELIFKINNKKIPLPIDVLEISSDNIVNKGEEIQIDSEEVFDSLINEKDQTILIEQKPLEIISKRLSNLVDSNKLLHLVLKVKKSKHLRLEMLNCDMRLHNSTHFKHGHGKKENKNLVKSNPSIYSSPVEVNPNFEKFSCLFNNSNVIFEKFDHKFLNGNYTYEFKIQNKSEIMLRKFFIHKMELCIDSSKIFIEKLSGYKISKDDENHIKNSIYIKSNKSFVKIYNFINCGDLIYNSSNTEELCLEKIESCVDFNAGEQKIEEKNSESSNNTLSIDNFYSNSFDIRLSDNDKLDINLYEISDNSNLQFRKCNNFKLRIHPVLLCGINVFQEFNKKFMKVLFFEDEGFIQSPTLVLNGDKEMKKKDITGWELVKLKDNRYLKIFILISFLSFVVSLFVNDDGDFNRKYSEFKLYQVYLKKTLENYLENIEK